MPGEYAEMMLDGTCCAGCGEFLGGEADGFPCYCSPECARDCGVDLDDGGDRLPCPECDRSFTSERALGDHFEAKHGGGTCQDCGKSFGSSTALEQHRHMKHGSVQAADSLRAEVTGLRAKVASLESRIRYLEAAADGVPDDVEDDILTPAADDGGETLEPLP